MHPIDALNDRTVILALQEFSEQQQGAGPSSTALNETEAREAVQVLTAIRDLDDLLEDESAALAAARRLLTVVVADPDTATVAAPLLDDPPVDDQLTVETAVTGLVVLAGVISWLQAKLDIQMLRKDGKVEFTFHLHKASTDPQVIKDIAKAAIQVFTGKSPADS